MIELRPSRSGHTTALCDGIAIHSAYDPRREARRFLEAASVEAPGTVLILGEGVGHLSRAARELYPGARVVALHYASELWGADPAAAHAAWHPGAEASLEEFLRSTLTELDAEGMHVVEWPPSAAAFPALARRALEAVAQVVREINGSVATTARTGRRWLHNAVRNFLLGPDPLPRLPVDPSLPIVIAASGPSLVEASPMLRELRRGLSLWALPSAVDHLLAAGIVPDLVVVTDAVYYSVYHTHVARGREIPIALPLSAAPGLWRVSSRLVYLAQPSFYEIPLLTALGSRPRPLPPHGTVAGTALELALRTAREGVPVVLAGLDLCYRDILSHARPNAFEHFVLPGIGRLEPLHHRLAAGALDATPTRLACPAGAAPARTSLPLQTYAGWFAAGDSAWRGRVRRLLPSPVELPSIPTISPGELRALSASPAADRQQPDPERLRLTRSERRRILTGLIGTWRDLIASSRGPEPFRHRDALEIIRQVSLRGLIELRRRLRTQGEGAAEETWGRLLQETDDLFAGLERFVREAGDA